MDYMEVMDYEEIAEIYRGTAAEIEMDYNGGYAG